jgi:hypothetical protein
MATSKRNSSNMVYAREAIVINVGGRPIEYGRIKVADRKTGEVKEIDNQNQILDPGDEGIPYAFKANQKVSADHPAVLACPAAFGPVGELEELEVA